MSHKARKRFGQNFLSDEHVIHRILMAIRPKEDDNLLEIGPGLGALTIPLLHHVNHLNAIEIDRDLQAHLKALPEGKGKLNIIEADALTVDFSQFGTHLRIIGNLPYNISTPIIMKLLDDCEIIDDMHFMLQKEVVDRMAASHGSKAYGRLSIMVQYFCEAEALFDVPPESFSPAPKVNSAIVRLKPKPAHEWDRTTALQLKKLVTKAFAMRRKTIANNLKDMISVEQLEKAGINPKTRPEQIALSDYLRLVKMFPLDV